MATKPGMRSIEDTVTKVMGPPPDKKAAAPAIEPDQLKVLRQSVTAEIARYAKIITDAERKSSEAILAALVDLIQEGKRRDKRLESFEQRLTMIGRSTFSRREDIREIKAQLRTLTRRVDQLAGR